MLNTEGMRNGGRQQQKILREGGEEGADWSLEEECWGRWVLFDWEGRLPFCGLVFEGLMSACVSVRVRIVNVYLQRGTAKDSKMLLSRGWCDGPGDQMKSQWSFRGSETPAGELRTRMRKIWRRPGSATHGR